MAPPPQVHGEHWLAASGWYEGATLHNLKPATVPGFGWLMLPSYRDRQASAEDEESEVMNIWHSNVGLDYAERQAAIQIGILNLLISQGAELAQIVAPLALHVFPHERSNKALLFDVYYQVLPANICESPDDRTDSPRIIAQSSAVAAAKGYEALGNAHDSKSGSRRYSSESIARFILSAATVIPNKLLGRWDHRFGDAFNSAVMSGVNAYYAQVNNAASSEKVKGSSPGPASSQDRTLQTGVNKRPLLQSQESMSASKRHATASIASPAGGSQAIADKQISDEAVYSAAAPEIAADAQQAQAAAPTQPACSQRLLMLKEEVRLTEELLRLKRELAAEERHFE